MAKNFAARTASKKTWNPLASIRVSLRVLMGDSEYEKWLAEQPQVVTDHEYYLALVTTEQKLDAVFKEKSQK